MGTDSSFRYNKQFAYYNNNTVKIKVRIIII